MMRSDLACARCQQCQKPSSSWRSGQGKSAFCDTCRSKPAVASKPVGANTPVARTLPEALEIWRRDPTHLAVLSGGTVELRRFFANSTEVAGYSSVDAAASAIETDSIAWRTLSQKRYTLNVEAVSAGLDGVHMLR